VQQSTPYLLRSAILQIVLLSAGMLLAVWLRYEINFGNELGTEYQAWGMIPFVIGMTPFLTYFAVSLLEKIHFFRLYFTTERHFRLLLLSASAASAITLVFLPDVSQLQVAYFFVTTVIVGFLVIVLPSRLQIMATLTVSIGKSLSDLWAYRTLICIWLVYRIESRYRQTILGILWIVLLPVASSLVLAFAFTQLLGAGNIVDVPFVAFLLTGSTIFSIFQTIIQRSKGEILGKISLIKQVYFPREIIIILIAGEALIDFVFTFVTTIAIIMIFYGYVPTLLYFYLFIPIFLLFALSVGLALILSYLVVRIRDLQQLIDIVMQLLFFVTVLYAPGRTSGNIERFMALNPLSPIVNAFRDILLYERMPDFTALIFPTILAIILLYVGYIVFKLNEDLFVEMA
jgi:lipopolysaccharide transport system permease protein